MGSQIFRRDDLSDIRRVKDFLLKIQKAQTIKEKIKRFYYGPWLLAQLVRLLSDMPRLQVPCPVRAYTRINRRMLE